MDKNKVKRVLIITLSNIGDAILSFPVIDGVLNGMPDAQVSVMVGPKSRHLFENNKCIDEVIIYNKKLSIFKKITWIFSLRKKRFDFIIDLKNSGMPLLLSPKYCTPLDGNKKESVHMKDKHLNRLKLIYPFEIETSPRHMFETTEEDVSSVDHLLKEASGQRFFVVAPGSLNEYKRWAETNFTKVCNKINKEHHLIPVFLGDEQDRLVAKNIVKYMDADGINLCGKTSFVESAEILRRADFALVNDSGPMHMACYLDVPVVAIFGPSKPYQYGPWGKGSIYLKGEVPFFNNDLSKDQAGFTDINSVTPEQVLESFSITETGIKIHNG